MASCCIQRASSCSPFLTRGLWRRVIPLVDSAYSRLVILRAASLAARSPTDHCASLSAQLQPMLLWTPVPPQFNPVANRRHRRVQPSVPIKIHKHHPAMDPRRHKLFPHRLRNICKLPCAFRKIRFGSGSLASSPPPATKRSSHPSLSKSQPASPTAPLTAQ